MLWCLATAELLEPMPIRILNVCLCTSTDKNSSTTIAKSLIPADIFALIIPIKLKNRYYLIVALRFHCVLVNKFSYEE